MMVVVMMMMMGSMDKERGDCECTGGKGRKDAFTIVIKGMIGWIISVGGELNCERMI
jgi:hypothetical protein